MNLWTHHTKYQAKLTKRYQTEGQSSSEIDKNSIYRHRENRHIRKIFALDIVTIISCTTTPGGIILLTDQNQRHVIILSDDGSYINNSAETLL